MRRSTFLQFSAPSVLIMFLLMVIPIATAVYLSLHFVTFQNINAPQFRGFSNYVSIFSDPEFWRAFRFSLVIVLVVVPLQITLGFTLALILDQLRSGGRGIFVAVILLPFIVVPVVGTLMFKQQFELGGLISHWHREIFDKPFLFNATTVKVLIITHLVWAVTPYPAIVFFAGLQGLPEVRLEAAEVDGANRFQQLFYVTIPYLKPLFIMTIMILMMDMYRMFDSIMVLTEQNPIFKSENLMMYNFRIGMKNHRLGLANTTAILTIIGVMVVLIPFLRITYKNQIGKE